MKRGAIPTGGSVRALGSRLAGLVVVPIVLCVLLPGCGSLPWRGEKEPLPVKKVPEEIVVAAWAEPARLPSAGGQAHILVRVQKRGGAPYPGVEVRLATSRGSLYSRGDILLTDGRGMTRDRLSTRRSAVVTLNAGGTRYTFRVPVGEPVSSEARPPRTPSAASRPWPR